MVLAALFLHLSCFAANITCGGGTTADFNSGNFNIPLDGRPIYAPAIVDSTTYAKGAIIKRFQYTYIRNNCYNSTGSTTANAYLEFYFPSESTANPSVTNNSNYAVSIEPIQTTGLITGNSACTVTKEPYASSSATDNKLIKLTLTIPPAANTASRGCTMTFNVIFNFIALANDITILSADTTLVKDSVFTTVNGLPGGVVGLAVWTTRTGSLAPLGISTVRVVIPNCTLAPRNFNLVVTLPTVDISTLATQGNTSGTTTFNIPLSACNAAPFNDPVVVGLDWFVKAHWTFTPAPNASTTKTIANTAPNPAANVALQLLDTSGNPIGSGDKTLISKVIPVALSTGPSAWRYQINTPNPTYSVRYYATGPAGPGAVKGTATFNLFYD